MNPGEITKLLMEVEVEVRLDEEAKDCHVRLALPVDDLQAQRLKQIPLDTPVRGIAATAVFMALVDALQPGGVNALHELGSKPPFPMPTIGDLQSLSHEEAQAAFDAGRQAVDEVLPDGDPNWASIDTIMLGSPDHFLDVSMATEEALVELSFHAAPTLAFAATVDAPVLDRLIEALQEARARLPKDEPHPRTPRLL